MSTKTKYQTTVFLDAGCVKPARNAVITVYNAGTTTKAQIYEDAQTTKANPFAADNGGFFYFYALAGYYDIKVVSPYGSRNITGVELLANTQEDMAQLISQQIQVKLPSELSKVYATDVAGNKIQLFIED